MSTDKTELIKIDARLGECDPAFHIENENGGTCEHCNHTTGYWSVVGPDGVAIGTSYGSEEDAESMADSLTYAFNLGWTMRDKQAIEEALEPQ